MRAFNEHQRIEEERIFSYWYGKSFGRVRTARVNGEEKRGISKKHVHWEGHWPTIVYFFLLLRLFSSYIQFNSLRSVCHNWIYAFLSLSLLLSHKNLFMHSTMFSQLFQQRHKRTFVGIFLEMWFMHVTWCILIEKFSFTPTHQHALMPLCWWLLKSTAITYVFHLFSPFDVII